MGALPKNKITRNERLNRRRGNTPDLTKDVKTAKIPLSKRTVVSGIKRLIAKKAA